MINLFFIEDAAGREVRRFCFMGVVAFVSFRGCKWIIYPSPLYISLTQLPAMLRGTAGEQGYVRYKQAGEMSCLNPPAVTSCHLPYILLSKTQGRSFKKCSKRILALPPCRVP